MPFAFIDGFEDYPVDMNVPGVGFLATWNDSAWKGIGPGRFDGKSLGQAYGGYYWYRGIPPTTQLSFGMAYKVTSLNSHGTGRWLVLFQSIENTTQYCIGVDDLGYIRVGQQGEGPNIVTEAISTRKMLSNTWHYIEIELVLGNSNGRVKLFLDGEEQFELVNIDTQQDSSRNNIGRIRLGNIGECAYDDLYCKYDDATAIGECRVVQLLPAGDTADKDWTPLTGTENFAMVDEIDADLDVTYNYSNAVGARDLFTMTDFTGTPDKIHAVQVSVAAKKVDAGTRTIQTLLKSGTEDGLGAETNLVINYTWYRDIHVLDPNGDVEWTKESINALQTGYQLVL